MQPTPDISTLLKIAQSPAGQKLLAMLKASNPATLDSIAAAAASGDLETVRQNLSSILATKEARDLLLQLENQL